MGSSSSKPAEGQPAHVWKANGPVGVSQDVLESLRSTSETDTSRAQNLELAVQARVAEELKRLQAQESANLKAILDEASEAAEKEGAQKGKDDQKQLSSHAVSKEVEALRARLDKRKQLRELPESVEKARSSVISCLRENDRRPLNCWEEIEAFKDEVRKLEKGWVDRVVR